MKVYISKIPDEIKDFSLENKEREKEVLSSENERVKKERFYVFYLFEKFYKEYALSAKKTDSGKWVSKGIEFSFTHSGGFVAIAVASGKVGVDLEMAERFEKINPKSFLTEKEMKKDYCPEELCAIWTKKESLFKRDSGKVFIPKTAEIKEEVKTLKFLLDNKLYCLSVATGEGENKEIEIINV